MGTVSLAQALGELPDTADGIADLLQQVGIAGLRRSAYMCPLADWLASRTGAPVLVGERHIMQAGREYVLPDAAQRFITAFDNGRYSHLALPGPVEP